MFNPIRGILVQHALCSSMFQSLRNELLRYEFKLILNKDDLPNVIHNNIITDASVFIGVASVICYLGFNYYNSESMKKLLLIKDYLNLEKSITIVISIILAIFFHDINNVY
jgi:hypothetical protein